MFKCSRHNNSSVFIFSQDYDELSKRTNRANENIYHIFKPNNFRDVQQLFRDKASMDITLNGIKLLTSNCWNEYYQLLTFDMTKDKYTDCYSLDFYSLLFTDRSFFVKLNKGVFSLYDWKRYDQFNYIG